MSEYFDFPFLDSSDATDQILNLEGISLEDVDQFLNLDLDPATPSSIGTPSDHSGSSTENTVNSPQAGPVETAIQVSNTFNLNAGHDSAPPNTIIASIDNIFFAVHHHRLLACSINNFGGYLHPNQQPSSDKLISFLATEPSDIINVILHTVYNIPCDNYSPTLECLSTSLATFDKYGLLPLERFVSRGTPLFTTILNRAVVSPIETYALAASHALEDLAISASSYTLHIKLHLLPQILVDRMGTRYMQRLYKLHGDRMDSLRDLLDRKLFPHLATPTCSVEKRQVVSRALQLAGKQVMYDASPAMTRSGIENIMRGVAESVACEDCKDAVNSHIKDISTQWMILDRTI